MISPDDVAVSIVALNDGELIGRTRLQKTAFLLERCGMDSGLEFDYRHYGPFSVDLARGCDDAEFDGRLKMVERPAPGKCHTRSSLQKNRHLTILEIFRPQTCERS